MNTPNFIIGGTAAGGTSYLYELLIQHPEIYLPQERIPEPHYYYKSWEYEKGLKWYLKRYFHDVPKCKVALGERSSSYLYGGAKTASKIAKDFPKMKFIFMLRNPIQRAFANYRFTALQGLETLSFKDALLCEKERVRGSKGIWSEIQPYDYTGRGFYARQLKEFLEFFPSEQILCLKSEDVTRQNVSILRKIYEFLELKDTDFIPKEAPKHTSLSVIDIALQSRLRKHFGDDFSYLVNTIRSEQRADLKKESKMLFDNLLPQKETISLDCQELLISLYTNEIEALQGMVDFDPHKWLEEESVLANTLRGGGA